MSETQQYISKIDIVEWSLPLVAPFRVAARTSHTAHNILVKVTSSDGTVGIGATAPVEYVTGETQQTVRSALTNISDTLIGLAVDQITPLTDKLLELLPAEPSARAGIEMAIYDLWAKQWNLPLWQYFGGSRQTLTTDMTIPIVSAEEARLLAAQLVIEGFRQFKIKIGDCSGHDADLARIAAVAQAAPGCEIRIDANQAFSPESAVQFTEAAVKISQHIALVEQPVPQDDFEGLRYVREHVTRPVFADESARSYQDVKRLIRMEAVDGINIKLMKSAITESRDIANLCRRNNVFLMVGCMLESPLGIAAAASIAGGMGGFNFIDLDSHKLLKPVESLVGGFKAAGSLLTLNRLSPGWGIELDEKCDWNNTHVTPVDSNEED